MLRMLVPSTLMGPVVPICGIGSTNTGHAGARHEDVRLGHLAIVLQGRDRAVGHRVDRALGERRAGDRLEHVDEHRRLGGHAHLVLKVLAGVLEGDPRHLQVAHARIDVAGSDRSPR